MEIILWLDSPQREEMHLSDDIIRKVESHCFIFFSLGILQSTFPNQGHSSIEV